MNCYLLLVLLALVYTGTHLLEELLAAIIKLLPMAVSASVAVTLRLIMEAKKNKITKIDIFLSYVSAVGISYIFYPAIVEYSKPEFIPLSIGLVVLSGNQIVNYVVYKLKISLFLGLFFEWAYNKLKLILGIK